jgi:DNA polymerase I-like protein with 3'-5' exonuclease and polymerase domains
VARRLDYAGGNQLPMFLPESSWTRLEELPDLRQFDEIAIDTETRDNGLASGYGPGWAFRNGYISGVSVAYDRAGEETAFYIPLNHPDTDNFARDSVAAWLKAHSHLRCIFHNGPYDLGWFRADGLLEKPPEKIDDTTAMAVMIDEHEFSYSLDSVAARCGIEGKDETMLRDAASAYGFNPKSEMWRMPAKFVGPYAEQDALATLRAARSMRPRLVDEGTVKAYTLEMELIPLIQEMRMRGIDVDLDLAEQAKATLEGKRDEVFKDLSARLDQRVGMEEIGKTKWLRAVFDAEGIEYPFTERGNASFTAGVTGWMHKHPHWLPQLIVKADKYHNAASKFIQGYIIDYCHRGRIHPSINQFRSEDETTGTRQGTRSHRFSYSDPPLQQMPSRDPEITPLIRGCFKPRPGEKWARIDYEQQEYRLMVHFASLLGLPKADEAADKYRNDPNTDFHQLVAELTGLDRTSAKQTNFAKAYGAGLKQFMALTNMSEADASRVMSQYDNEMPFINELNEECKRQAGRRGFIRLIDGARSHYPFWEGPWLSYSDHAKYAQAGLLTSPCRLPEAEKRQENEDHPWHGKRLRRADTRKAMNNLIQGSAARQTKIAMRDAWKEGIVPLLQIHDELAISTDRREEGERLAEIMRDAVKLVIPVGAAPDWGLNWAHAKPVKGGYSATWEAAHEVELEDA